MNFDLILKKTVKDLSNYFNEECFKDLKINSKTISIGADEIIENINTENLEPIDRIISQLNSLRQENQDLLAKENTDYAFYASTEILLSSATEAFKQIKESFRDLNFLKIKNSERNLLDINEKFVVSKLTANSQRVLGKYENLSPRFIKNEKVNDFLECLGNIAMSQSINEILIWANKVLIKQDEIKRLDHFVDYNALVDEYGWVHDIVKLSSANAEFMGLIVNIEIFTNVINQQYVNGNRVNA